MVIDASSRTTARLPQPRRAVAGQLGRGRRRKRKCRRHVSVTRNRIPSRARLDLAGAALVWARPQPLLLHAPVSSCAALRRQCFRWPHSCLVAGCIGMMLSTSPTSKFSRRCGKSAAVSDPRQFNRHCRNQPVQGEPGTMVLPTWMSPRICGNGSHQKWWDSQALKLFFVQRAWPKRSAHPVPPSCVQWCGRKGIAICSDLCTRSELKAVPVRVARKAVRQPLPVSK